MMSTGWPGIRLLLGRWRGWNPVSPMLLTTCFLVREGDSQKRCHKYLSNSFWIETYVEGEAEEAEAEAEAGEVGPEGVEAEGVEEAEAEAEEAAAVAGEEAEDPGCEFSAIASFERIA